MGSRWAAGGQQRMHVARQRLAGVVVQVEVVDRHRGHAQPASGGGAGQLRGQGGLAAALRACDAVDPRAAFKDVIKHLADEAGVEGVDVARVQRRGHAATIAQ